MGIDQARYHSWEGHLRSPWLASLAIVGVAVRQVLRRKFYWIVLALGLTQFLLFWSIIYGLTQLKWPREVQEQILDQFGFSAHPEDIHDSGYIQFMERQNVVVLILLAFSGSLLVGADFRLKSLPFYLSRRIERRHYIVAKLLAVSSLIAILTLIPALLLFVEYGMFTSSLAYWRDNWRVPLAILAYGAVVCAVSSTLLVSLSAYLQRAAPIAITWASLFFLPGRLASYLRDATGDEHWRLLDLWRDMRLVGRLCFGAPPKSTVDGELAWWALLILSVLCGVALAALVHRVRAVDISE